MSIFTGVLSRIFSRKSCGRGRSCHIGAFPVDTWIKKILLREYAPKSRCTSHVPESRLCEALIEENFSKYPGFAGVLQQYIFFYEREFSQKNTAGYERNQI